MQTPAWAKVQMASDLSRNQPSGLTMFMFEKSMHQIEPNPRAGYQSNLPKAVRRISESV
jgi:hypothetical protein